MILFMPLPAGRTLEQVENHYLVEKEIAECLKGADRERRKVLYKTMYDELFRRVPDHPRLRVRDDEELSRRRTATKLALLRRFLQPSSVVAEFAAGDCRFAAELARHVETVYAVDISDQRGPNLTSPPNVEFVLYDGYHLSEIADETVDLVFSDQLIEHLHPEDTEHHFRLVHRLLKPGGKYLFRTPHAFPGPHDVSRYFSPDPHGFHLKEWTFRELELLLRTLRFSGFQVLHSLGGVTWPLPYSCVQTCEWFLDLLPPHPRRKLARYLIPSICVLVSK